MIMEKPVTISSTFMKRIEETQGDQMERKSSVKPVDGLNVDRDLNRNQKGDVDGDSKPGNPGHPDPRAGCCWNGSFFLDAIKAMLTRMLFLLHAWLAIWRVTIVTEKGYWLLTMAFLGLIIETFLVLIKRRGHEWRWFQWSVFLYLAAVLPPIWIIELKELGLWQYNGTVFTTDLQEQKDSLSSVIPVSWKPKEWAVALEQGLLVLIIIGRWLMPKGELTRNQLSALLLVHLGTASDIVDCLTILSETEVRASPEMSYTTLSVWTWALCQFPFVVTVTKNDKERPDDDSGQAEGEETEQLNSARRCSFMQTMLETEAWGICVSVFMQDGPFLIVRLIAIFKYHVVTYTNYFFTAKNGLVLLLQMYRLLSICVEHKQEKEKKEREKEQARQLWEKTKHKMWMT